MGAVQRRVVAPQQGLSVEWEFYRRMRVNAHWRAGPKLWIIIGMVLGVGSGGPVVTGQVGCLLLDDLRKVPAARRHAGSIEDHGPDVRRIGGQDGMPVGNATRRTHPRMVEHHQIAGRVQGGDGHFGRLVRQEAMVQDGQL